ncbi:MAG: hypothetical protein AB201_00965 [Parcubacteria bacterium C7867-006]|nr:MAG: hypothetical protein AB201_00965 [Parcubacteria bacterium C7867-006]
MTLETEEVNGVIRIKNPDEDLKEMHYYGDRVRMLYIGMSVILLVMSPFVQNRLPYPALLSIFAVLFLTMVAGLISPKAKAIIILNFLVSVTAIIVFGKEAIVSYSHNLSDIFFWGNVVLSVASIFALYYSSKTLRGVLLYKK